MHMCTACMHVLIDVVFPFIKSSEERLQVGFSFGLLIVPFIPSTGIIFRVGFVVAERSDCHVQYEHQVVSCAIYRVLYLPSLGYCLIVAIGCQRLHSILPKVHNFITVCYLLFYVLY